MTRVLLSIALFVGVLVLLDYTLTGGYTVYEASRFVGRMFS